jgi:restriction system protein
MAKKQGAQFVRYFGPLLDALRELGGSATPAEATDKIAEMQDISEEVQNELLPSGNPRFRNQVAWARFYLKREGLLDSSKRGVWSLTEKGESTKLSYEKSRKIFLKQVKLDAAARKLKLSEKEEVDADQDSEVAEPGVGYRDQLLEIMKGLSPAGFERLCQQFSVPPIAILQSTSNCNKYIELRSVRMASVLRLSQ